MRKNRTLRVASLLLALTLITSCFVGSTFAKYTTSTTGKDSARVAHWGWNNPATIDITGLFNHAYDQNVNSDTDIIAPGTKNSATFSFVYNEKNGSAPEVAYTFEVSTAGSTIDSAIENNASIIWSLDGISYPATATETSWDQLIKAIEALDGSEEGAATYQPQQMPDAFSTGDTVHTVGWKWVFYKDGGQDVVDTEMGNAENLDEVEIVITITATQLD